MKFIKKEKIVERAYQRNIFESVKDENSLVVLPTGLGKTMISILVIDYRLNKYPGTKALFMAPTKPLIDQHYRTFADFTTFDVGIVSGTVSPKKRKDVYEGFQVIFATPQTIENDIRNAIIDVSDFSSLVVDEAHHSIGNYSYVYVVKEFLEKSKYPHVLALTASPASDSEKIKTICKNLGINKIEIRSETDPDVTPYVKSKIIEEIEVDLPDYLLSVVNSVKRLINTYIDELKAVGLFKDTPNSRINRKTLLMMQKNMQSQMAHGNRAVYVIRGIITISKILKLYHLLDLLSTQSVSASKKFISKLLEGTAKSDKELSHSIEFKAISEMVDDLVSKGLENPKMEEVRRILQRELLDGKKAIVFTQYRDNVDAIFEKVKDLPNVSVSKFIGQAGNGLSQQEQANIIRDFEAGVYNVIISTSVSEEGMSIKGADIAIFYETIPSAIRSIQRKGRVGRYDTGKIYILIVRGTSDQGYYWVSLQRERRMRKIIKKIQENPNSLKYDGTLSPFT